MTFSKETNRPIKKSGLGKGLNSLLGLNENLTKPSSELNDEISNRESEEVINGSMVLKISPKDIEPNPHQPRRVFKEEDLTSLANSIKVDGIIQPLIVTKGDQKGKYTLIAGERRWRASQLLGLELVPVIVKDVASDDLLRIALIENIQRSDLNIIEEAEAYASLINDFSLTQEECARKVGKERATVTNTLRLLALPREIQDDLMDDRLSMGHGRALLGLEDTKLMLRARDIVIKKKLNVRQTEQLCKSFKKNNDNNKNNNEDISPDLNYLADHLRSILRTKVKLQGTGSRGKIEISYFSAAELERILGIVGYNLK